MSEIYHIEIGQEIKTDEQYRTRLKYYLELLKEKADYNSQYQELQEKLEDASKELEKEDKPLEEMTIDEKNYVEEKNNIIKNMSIALLNLHDKLTQINEEISLCSNSLGGTKYYDKKILFENIRLLAKEKGIKLGDIERNSGNTVGYMSRLDKENNMSPPNFDFVITASHMLDVSVEKLIGGKLEELDENEELLLKFIKKIKNQTDHRNIYWNKETEKLMNGGEPFSPQNAHPLHRGTEGTYIDSDLGLVSGMVSYYSSKFVENGVATVLDASYNADLRELGGTVYIVPVKYDAGNCYYELYIVNGNRADALCTTKDIKKVINDEIEELYKEIVKGYSSIRLQPDLKNAISKYVEKE